MILLGNLEIIMSGIFLRNPAKTIKSGFKIEKIQPIHRYGLSNILSWLRDGKPTGHKNFPQINSTIDKYWRDYLEKNEQSDCLFILLSLDKNI